jgi:molybdate transport system permease protein
VRVATAGHRRVPRRTPPLVAALAGVGFVLFVAVPLLGLAQRAPWSTLADVLATAEVREALRLSAVVSLAAAAASVVLGVPLAWWLARTESRMRAVVRALVLLPMVLPPVVGGVALLTAFGRRGLVGQYLDRWFDVQLTFTTAGAVVAATFVAMPFLVLTVEAALRSVDVGAEEAAVTLGARPLTVMSRVVLPAVRPALVAGALLAWARALGEFGATITFAGNVEGRTRTMPLAIFLALERDRDAAVVLSLVLLAVSVTVLAVVGSRTLAAARRAT